MKALLDACVLFPTILREILTDTAEAGLFAPLWSERILGEWVHAAAKLGPDQSGLAGAEAALLRLRFPQAMIAAGDESSLGMQLPDPGDLHVLKAALDGGAELIVTLNLRDFPPRILGYYGMRAIHPDEFLHAFAQAHLGVVAGAVSAALRRANEAGGQLTQRDMLARARLPRLNKLLLREADKAGVTGTTGGRA